MAKREKLAQSSTIIKDIQNLPPGDQHRILVDLINNLFPDYFARRNGFVLSTEIHDQVTSNETRHLAIICSRLLNMQGASVGEINLYELFDSYLLDKDKRALINEVLKLQQ